MPALDLHEAPLLRYWAERGLLKLKSPTQDLGGRLAAWLDVRQAIQLRQQLETPVEPDMRSVTPDACALREQLDQLRDVLQSAISSDRFASGLWRNPMPDQVLVTPVIWDDLWEPYRRYLMDHQKQMTLLLGRWRRQARSMMLKAGGECQALARLDAVYDLALSAKESRLLSTLPVRMSQLLARRLRENVFPSPDAQAPAERSVSTPAWLTQFENDLRGSLRAELELRLQPLWGLMEAFESKHS
jgi:hypothetical protein